MRASAQRVHVADEQPEHAAGRHERQAHDERAAVADEIAQLAARALERDARDEIARHEPLREVRGLRADVAADAGQRDGNHRAAERSERGREQHARERRTAAGPSSGGSASGDAHRLRVIARHCSR